MDSGSLITLAIVAIILLWLIGSSLRLCNEWERKVVLRLGRFVGVRGPGLFFLLPQIETTPFTIDMRVNTSSYKAEQTLTKDGASVTVDAIVYWQVVNAERASLGVANYIQAVMGAAQGALRDIIGRSDLGTLLSQRRELDVQLTEILDEQTEAWGIKVQSVQLRDIIVPDSLQDALSRMAQAQRERQARVILGESEVSVAKLFNEAGDIYTLNPTALHLRGMNMLYEVLRSGTATVVVVPSSSIESMNLGAMGGISALAKSAAEGTASPVLAPTPPTLPETFMPLTVPPPGG